MVHCSRFQKAFPFLTIFLLSIFSIYGQTNKETVMVLGVISNKTTNSEYDELNILLHETLENHPFSPETILDTLILLDTVLDESAIIRAVI